MIPPQASLLEEIAVIAREAGEIVLGYYRNPSAARTKTDRSPVTDADEASERLILERLAAVAPGIPVVSEEAVARGEGPAVGFEDAFFLVDPLDGTREFVAGREEFSINIALIEHRQPVLGVLLAPVSGTLYRAAGPGTAAIERAGAPPHPIHVRPPPPALVAVSSRSHGDQTALAAYLDQFQIGEHRRLGSAIKFGLIAEGAADLYARPGPTMEWDTAAGHAILEAAGGNICTFSGRPLLYAKPEFRNPDFIAQGGLPSPR